MMVNKKKKETLTPEQLQEQQKVNELNNLRENIHLIPEPTYQLEIGQEVTVGHLEDVIVVDILENGKMYEIDYTAVDHNYGNPIRTEHRRKYFKWLDIRTKHDNKDSLIKNDDIRLSYSQRSMRDLFGKAYFFGIDFDPEYQRDYVWHEEDKINLIDSIFNHVEIGKFVFIKNDYGEKYLFQVLDGKQRMRAILDFYEDRFQYMGKYFSELSPRDQSHFEDYPISMAEVSNLSQEQILKYFIKLNTGGRIMQKEHLDKVKQMLDTMESK